MEVWQPTLGHLLHTAVIVVLYWVLKTHRCGNQHFFGHFIYEETFRQLGALQLKFAIAPSSQVLYIITEDIKSKKKGNNSVLILG